MAEANRQILLAALPTGKLGLEHFSANETDMPVPADGEALVRTLYVALDAANRAWMMGATYRAGLNAGEVMAGAALAEVVESRDPSLSAGDIVYADTGWQTYAALPARQLVKVARTDPLTHLLSVYGTAGLTAYLGLMEIGRPKEGDTVVVSAAGGAVGSLVGQIAKLKGCRVVGIAGGQAKCDLLTSEFGFDAAVDYKGLDLRGLAGALMAAAPGGVDIYFDNVGGDIMEANVYVMKNFGRIICCGSVSQYDEMKPRLSLLPGPIVSKRLTLRGFIVSDFFAKRAEALDELKGWVESGQLQVREDIIDGLENLPGALIGLLAGKNIGKRMVKVG